MTDPTPTGYASDPVLGIIWGPPPAYTGSVPNSTGSGGNTPADHPAFIVNLMWVSAAEQTMLLGAQEITGIYNPLETEVQSEIADATMFGQKATYTFTELGGGTPARGIDQPGSVSTVEDTQLQQDAAKFAAQINPAMTRVLRMIADATETAGVFVALLDKTGQLYTAADKASVFPTPAPVKPLLSNPHDNPAAAAGH